MWRLMTWSVAVLLAMSGSEWCTAAKATRVAWERSLASATARAKQESKPVLIALSADHDAECDDLADFVYPSLTFVRSSQRAVCLVACATAHREIKDEATGALVCGRFGTVRCTDHIAVAEEVARRFLQEQDDFTPRHLVLVPDGTLIAMRDGFFDEHSLRHLIDRAVDATLCPSLAVHLEREHVLTVLDDTITGSRDVYTAGVQELGYLLSGWSRDVAIDVIKARAPAALRQHLARELVEYGPRSQTALLALAADPVASVRCAAVAALATVAVDVPRPLIDARLRVERDTRVRRALINLLARPAPEHLAAGS